jgi:hypothetical protein
LASIFSELIGAIDKENELSPGARIKNTVGPKKVVPANAVSLAILALQTSKSEFAASLTAHALSPQPPRLLVVVHHGIAQTARGFGPAGPNRERSVFLAGHQLDDGLNIS